MYRLKKILIIILFTMMFTTIILPVQISTYTVAEAATINLNKTVITVYTGNTYSLKMIGTNSPVKWSSSDRNVAFVSSMGLVSGIKKGQAIIIATVGTNKYACKVTVKAPSISFTKLTLGKAEVKSLKIIGSTGKVTWKSSNATIASINYKGEVYAKSEGLAKITGLYQGRLYYCTVKVLKGKIQADKTNVTISGTENINISVADLQPDENLQYEIANTDIADVEVGKWTDNTIPIKIIPLKKGTTTITLTTDYKAEELSIQVSVTGLETERTTLSTNQTTKMSAEEVYQISSPSTVQIDTNEKIGTGFFIKENVIVTNYHVVENSLSIKVQLSSGEEYEIESVLGYSKDLDIAVLKVPVSRTPLSVNTHSSISGETVYAIGSSQGLTDTFTNGIVSKASRVFDNVDYIQHSAPITKGNSGGPLLNAYGEVMGINTMQYIDGQNINFAINISQLSKVNLTNPITASQFYMYH